MATPVFPTFPGARPEVERETLTATSVYQNPGGFETRISRQSAPKYRFRFRVEVLVDADGDTDDLLNLFADRLGAADDFWLADPKGGTYRLCRFEEDSLSIRGIAVGLWEAEFSAVTVSPLTLTSIAVTPVNPTKASGGQTQQFACTGTMSDSSTMDLTTVVTWGSSVTARATINAAGLATTGAQTGVTVISATFGTLSDSTNLTVT